LRWAALRLPATYRCELPAATRARGALGGKFKTAEEAASAAKSDTDPIAK
jgi:hypothetical protein